MLISNRRILLSIFVGFLVATLNPSALSAHTNLISSNPAAGAIVESWPTQIILEFDEPLLDIGESKSNYVVVNNAIGDQVSNNDEAVDSNQIKVTLSPNKVLGQVLIFYRVISADGHPVEGEFTFSYGKGTEPDQPMGEKVKNQYPIGVYLASAAFIASGIFFAIYSYRRRLRD